jgi:glutamate-1-semialdehyde 2,1-aminomutase
LIPQTETETLEQLVVQVKKKTKRSAELFEESRKVLPGGVRNSINVHFPYPISLARGSGSQVWDVDGNQYTDYWMGHGSLALGHAHPDIVNAVRTQAGLGLMLDQHESELRLAQKLTECIPSAELVRFTVSGTEASLHTMRLAKAFTGKPKLIKFEGSYHGAHDSLLYSLSPKLAAAGKRESPNTVPESLGLPQKGEDNVIILPYNDPEPVEAVLEKSSDQIAAIVVEPVQRSYAPKADFLQKLRTLTKKYGVLLIFDEVITGFRFALGGAQEYYGVTPDLSYFAKGMGGGVPIGAFVGKREIMELTSPDNRKSGVFSFHAGTFGGNPVSMAAGLAALAVFEKPGYYQNLKSLTELLAKGLRDAVEDSGIKANVFALMGMWYLYFTEGEVYDYRSAATHNSELFKEFYFRMLLSGINCNFPVRSFVTSAHSKEDIENTRVAVEQVLKRMRR